MSVDLIRKYGLLNYRESKTLRFLQLFRDYLGIPIDVITVLGKPSGSNIRIPDSDEIAELFGILDVLTIDWKDQGNITMYSEYSDRFIDQLAEEKDYVALHQMRRDINILGTGDDYRYGHEYEFLYDQGINDIFNGGDIPGFKDDRKYFDDSIIPLFSEEQDGISSMSSIFVTPNSINSAKLLWDTWGPENKDYKYLFCLLQICKIQDIIHLARMRGEATPINLVHRERDIFNRNAFYELPLDYYNRKIDPIIQCWYGVFINRWNVDFPSDYYSDYAVIILDSPFQTIPVDLSQLYDPEYAKEWIFHCLDYFAKQLNILPPVNIEPFAWLLKMVRIYEEKISSYHNFPISFHPLIEKQKCDCNICYDDVATNGIVLNPENMTLIQPCNHCFHRRCIIKWIRKGNRTCPNCHEYIQSCNVFYR